MRKRTHFIGHKRRNRTWNLIKHIYKFRLFALLLIGLVTYYYFFSQFVENLGIENGAKRIDKTGIKRKRKEVFENIKQVFPGFNTDGNDSEHDYEDLKKEKIEPVSESPEKSGVETIKHQVYKSKSKRFFALDAFLFDGDRNRPSFSANTDDYLIVVLGIGEFTAKPHHIPKDVDGVTSKEIPSLYMNFKSSYDNIDMNVPLIVHTNGTYFQKKYDRYNNLKYSGEKGVWLTGLLPRKVGEALAEYTEYKTEVGIVSIYSDEKSLVFRNHPFVLENVTVFNYLAPNVASNNLVLCTAAIYNVKGFRFLLEYILYHKIVGFDKLHLYFYSKRYLEKIEGILNHFEDYLVVHDWSPIPSDIPSVKILNYEHAQRLARNDCFFRNRGVSNYVAFSDFDELFVPNYQDLEYDSVVAIKDLVQALETRQLDSYLSSNRFRGINKMIDYMENIHKSNPKIVAFEYVSVTVPPFDVYGQSFRKQDLVSLPNLKFHNEDNTEDFDGYFKSMSVAETKCTVPYNCGRYHEGRQKYILRVAKGSINPNSPLFYHAVSEEYQAVADHLTVQIPTSIGYLRHFAGHFKSSRFGGLPVNNRKIMPLPYFVLKGIRDAVEENKNLQQYYFDKVNADENYLKLYDFRNKNRFIKDSDENYVLVNLNTTRPQKKYLTFDRFGGRLNNQLFTLDWTFRLSKAFKRTLYLTKPRKMISYVGLPQTKEEEKHQSAVWRTTLLRKHFDFIMYYELQDLSPEVRLLLEKDPADLPEKCVWDYNRNHKILPEFLKKINNDADCKRVHFLTGQGLIHPKRSDTRRYGVGPLYFWSALIPNYYITKRTESFVNSVRERHQNVVVGFHSRHYKLTSNSNICSRLADKTITSVKKYMETFESCCKHPKPAFNRHLHSFDSTFLNFDVSNYQKILKYDRLCDIPDEYLNMFQLDDRKKYTILVAQDNRSVRIFNMFKKFGALSFDQSREIHESRPPNAVHHEIRSTIETTLSDMLTLRQVDFFHGSGASTLSQVVCFLRLSEAKRKGLEERSNVCHLALLSTGSYTCDSLCCSSTDLQVPVLFGLAN